MDERQRPPRPSRRTEPHARRLVGPSGNINVLSTLSYPPQATSGEARQLAIRAIRRSIDIGTLTIADTGSVVDKFPRFPVITQWGRCPFPFSPTSTAYVLYMSNYMPALISNSMPSLRNNYYNRLVRPTTVELPPWNAAEVPLTAVLNMESQRPPRVVCRRA